MKENFLKWVAKVAIVCCGLTFVAEFVEENPSRSLIVILSSLYLVHLELKKPPFNEE